MKRKTARTVLTLAPALGVLILAWRGIHLDVPRSPLPPSFTLKIDGSAYGCTMTGNQADCTLRSPARH